MENNSNLVALDLNGNKLNLNDIKNKKSSIENSGI